MTGDKELILASVSDIYAACKTLPPQLSQQLCEKSFGKLIEQYPQHITFILHLKLKTAVRLKLPQTALAAADRILASSPTNFYALMQKIRILVEKQQYTKAEAVLESLAQKPLSPLKKLSIYKLYLKLLISLRMWKTAEAIADRALQEFPASPQLITLKAIILRNTHRCKDALSLLNRLPPDNPHVRIEKACTFLEMGLIKHAQSELSAAVLLLDLLETMNSNQEKIKSNLWERINSLRAALHPRTAK